MYSGWLLTNFSGSIFGAHQKIDRVARRHLRELLGTSSPFPGIREIMHFEGKNGPDGVKKKSPAVNEPWHYFDPFDEKDEGLLEIIKLHYDELVHQLKNSNLERAAFEAAWLSHAIVDGLTPAHHYPYMEKLAELRGEDEIGGRTSIKEKVYIKGENKIDTLSKNWAFWGAKGLFTNHFMFEWGVATVILPLKLTYAMPDKNDILEAETLGPIGYFVRKAKEVYLMDLYDTYAKRGWTPALARKVRANLAPTIIKTVTLFWYLAAQDVHSQQPISLAEAHK